MVVPSSRAAEVRGAPPLTREFSDFEEMQRFAGGWNTRCVKLTPGPFRGRITVLDGARVQLGTVFRSGAVLLQGTPPAGRSVIGASLLPEPLVVNGRTVSFLETFVAPVGREFELRSSGPSHLALLAVDAALVAEHAAQLRRAAPPPVRCASGRSQPQVPGWLSRAMRVLHAPGPAEDASAPRGVEDQLLAAASAVLHPEPCEVGPVDRTARLARRADAYLRERLDGPITLRHMCEDLDVPLRTLHHAFRRCFGTTPKAFHKALRLDSARRRLQAGAPGTSVTSVAVELGFFQLAHFAGDYRRMFGEPPSASLGRALGRAGALALAHGAGAP